MVDAIIWILLGLVIFWLIFSGIYCATEHTKLPKKQKLSKDAKIIDIKKKVVSGAVQKKFRTTVVFDDGFRYISHLTDTQNRFLSYKIGTSSETLSKITERAITAHTEALRDNNKVKKRQKNIPRYTYTDNEIQAYTQKYNNAFLILKDYNNGKFRNVSFKSDQILVDYIFNSIPLCFGWCVFHGNKDKKIKAITEAFRFLDDLIESAPKEMANEAAKLKATKIYYNSIDKMMVKYKKEIIDPAYIQDRSKENYNKLLTDFLKYICKIYPKIEWYDGIVEDFKHCMDEE